MKYIDADKLIADIESIINSDHPIEYDLMEKRAYNSALSDVINLITSLQQEQPEQTCKTCGFYENNCPFIRGKLIPYPNKVCKDYTYSAMKEQEQPANEDDEKFVKISIRKEYAEQLQKFGDEIQDGLSSFIRAMNQKEQPEVDLDKFTEKIKTFQRRYKHPEIISIKGAMAFMARMFYQYPNVARQWYEQLPKATMD